MNLTNFLKQTDAIAAQCSTEQLISFIHDTGRVLPEHYREDFLKRLKAIGGKKEKVNVHGFNEIYQLVRDNLKRIDSQEITVSGILNEEYEEWYDEDSEEFCYQDDSGISDMLAEACDYVHTCVDMERYEEGFKIGKQLLSMEILCVNDYDDEELLLKDMVAHKLLDRSLKQVILDTAYCAYHAVSLKKRPEALYEVIVNEQKEEITLEMIMQHGDEELPDFQDFLILWITCLGTKTNRDADRLIYEAVGLLNDVSAAAGYAEKYAAVHPGLYLNILENGKYADVKEMVLTGLKAMKIIPKKYIMRSRVALKTAAYIIQTNEKTSLLEKCYFAAYESDTSAINYLRALFNGYGTDNKREELQEVFMTLSAQKNGDSNVLFERGFPLTEREENKLHNNNVLLLRFLDGQFADVLADGLNRSEALGWTGTFMKQGIALYLLYLYEGQWTGKGIIAMADMVKNAMNFSAEAYQKGMRALKDIDENDLFCQLFLKWKSMVQMDPEVRIYAVKKITGLLEKRTEGIMSANRRGYYGECSAYIAALGEVRESLGEAGAKQKLMTSYRDKYSRRSAFREEMRRYGWKDVNR